MPVQSIRFSSQDVHARLREAARRRGLSASSLAEQLISEGLRMESHPQIVFREGPSGRRAALAAGPDVAEVVGAVVGGDVAPQERVRRAAELLALDETQVQAAMAYYAEFTDDVDAELATNADAAEREVGLWQRQQALLRR